MTADTFQIDPRLENDSFHISTINGCQIRLMNDARYPWVMLVPEAANASEIFDLPNHQATSTMALAMGLAEDMKQRFGAQKMNIATLSNVVRQLHIHVVARNENDFAWPGPVWGAGKAVPLSDEEKRERTHIIQMCLGHLTASSDAL